MEPFSALRKRLTAILPLAVPLKFVISALLGVIGSAGLLGFLSEYATYSYAIYYGMRPPLEGIPYLRPAVAFGFLFLVLSAALLFFAIFFALRLVVWYPDAIRVQLNKIEKVFGIGGRLQSTFLGYLLNRIRTAPAWAVFLGSVMLSALIVIVFALSRSDSQAVLNRTESVQVLVVVFLYILALFMAVVRPSTIWWTSAVVVGSYLLMCIFLLFTPVRYSELLRTLGYGGGLTVIVELREAGETTSNEPLQLMLRTNEAIILHDPSNRRFVEIPREQVRRIFHATGGTRSLPYALPVGGNY